MKAYLSELADSKTFEMAEMTRDGLIEAVKKAAAGEPSLTSVEFSKRSGIKISIIYRLFPEGGWKEVLKLAGLKDEGSRIPVSDEEILSEFHAVVTSIGKIPTWFLFDNKSKISSDLVRKRFGGTQGTLRRYADWLSQNYPSSTMIREIEGLIKDEPREEISTSNSARKWPKVNGTEYGEPIDFRGLRHAPTNEQGVVFLFGMVCLELGFMIESVRTGYPDCEGKRCVDQKKMIWEPILIEFEFKSSNFNHDPAGCDLVVCWIHDWPECPIEVLELKSFLQRLPARLAVGTE